MLPTARRAGDRGGHWLLRVAMVLDADRLCDDAASPRLYPAVERSSAQELVLMPLWKTEARRAAVSAAVPASVFAKQSALGQQQDVMGGWWVRRWGASMVMRPENEVRKESPRTVTSGWNGARTPGSAGNTRSGQSITVCRRPQDRGRAGPRGAARTPSELYQLDSLPVKEVAASEGRIPASAGPTRSIPRPLCEDRTACRAGRGTVTRCRLVVRVERARTLRLWLIPP